MEYIGQESRHLSKQQYIIKSLVQDTALKMSRTEIKKIIGENFSTDYIIKEDKTEISVDQVVFKFDGEKLVKVQSYSVFE